MTGENQYYGICNDCVPARILSEPDPNRSDADAACASHKEETAALTGPDAFRQVPTE
jgi:hypothetical protein